MKNQNDLIITVVTVVLALIAITAFYFTKPVVVQPPAPEKVIVTAPQMPQGDVQYATALPGASNAPGGGGAGGGRGSRGNVNVGGVGGPGPMAGGASDSAGVGR